MGERSGGGVPRSPCARGPAQISLNQTLDNTGLDKGTLQGRLGIRVAQEHPALLRLAGVKRIRRAKGCACWAPDSPAAAGLWPWG